MSKIIHISVLSLLICMSILISQTAISADGDESIGKLMFALGKVTITNKDGINRRVRRGAKIHEGDLIKTNNVGQAQIKFKDGARISIRSGSEFRVDRYVYDTGIDKSRYKSELSLLKGGLRSITGAIGKSNKKSYKMKTVVATIGIRGTDYSIMLCDHNCNNHGKIVNKGLYVGVVNGGITLNNDAASLDVSPNQYAMVGSAEAVPVMLLEPPSFLMFDKTAATPSERLSIAKAISKQRKDKFEKDGSEKNANQTKQEPTGESAEKTVDQRYVSSSQPTILSESTSATRNNDASYIPEAVNDPLVANVEYDTTTDDNLDSTTDVGLDTTADVSLDTTADVGLDTTAGVGLDTTADVGLGSTPEIELGSTTDLPESNLTRFFNFVFGDEETTSVNKITQLDSEKVNNITQLDTSGQSQSNYIEFTDGSTQSSDFGYDSKTGLSWGRWSAVNIGQAGSESTSEVDLSGIDVTNQSLHWVMGAEASDTVNLPITGQRNFILIGNTNPTDRMGNVGLLGSASLTANFDSQTVAADINLSINQQVWDGGSDSIPLDMSNGQFSHDQLTVNVTGGTDTGGSISGGLLDGDVNGAGFTYSLDANIDGTTNQVTGVAAFREVP